ncbi:phage terminase large subunit family protein [Vineibacter terrae]|nr:terminase gpA endonuclease subunit [Vineibacter terrae]
MSWPYDQLAAPRPAASEIEGLEPALRVAAKALAIGLKPPRRRSVAEWAEAEREVSSESGSPFPGRWSNDTAPHLEEIMECLSLSHPAREVTVAKGAQLGVTECGLNLIGQIATEVPCTVLVTLPSLDTLKSYIKTKLMPMIEASPKVKAAVREQKSRDEDGSTTSLKKFAGGWISLTTASSSKGLQMISVRVYIAEEISEYPFDVDQRGDPLSLGDARTIFWSGREKKFRNSTPNIKGSCRVTQRYEAGDMRQRYVPCPHCGDYQVLRWERMVKEGQWRGMIPCLSCGVPIEQKHKRAIMARGKAVWLKTYPGDGHPGDVVKPEEIPTFRARPSNGRQPSFWISGLYSPVLTWFDIVDDWDAAKGIQSKEKKFVQQVLGEAWEEKGEAPDHERLLERRQADMQPRRIPPGALFLTGAADVQGNRIEWCVWAWGIGYTRWLIDKGIIEGDPHKPEVWRKLDEVTQRRYEDWRGEHWGIDAFGCDSGYATGMVYRWALRHAGTGRIFALDGRPGWKLPPLGTPQPIDINYEGRKLGAVMLWPVGTWDLKSELYRSLRNLLDGRDSETGEWPIGTAFFGENVDAAWLQQLTCEYLADEVTKDGYQVRIWRKPGGAANEAHDIAVYAAALAHHLADQMSAEAWHALAARRAAPVERVQGDLAQLWGASLAQPASPPPPDPPAPAETQQQPAPTEAPADDWLGASSDWLGDRGGDWLN